MSFHQLITLLWLRRWLAIICFSIVVVTGVIATLLLPKKYMATTALVIDQRSKDPVSGAFLPVQLMFGYMATQVDIITSHTVARKVVDILKLDEDSALQASFQKKGITGDIRDWIAEDLLNKISVTPSRESSIIKMSFISKDPQFSALATNAFAKSYIQVSLDLKIQPAKLNAKWYDDQLSNLRNDLENAQKKLSVFQQTHDILMASEHWDLENSRLVELSKQLLENQGRTYELMSRKKQLAEALVRKGPIESLQDVLNNNLLQGLKGNLVVAESKFAEISAHLDINHPQYQKSQAEVSSLKRQIQAEINTVLNSISSNAEASQQRDASLAAALAEQKNRVLELKKNYDEITLLSREVENAQNIYDAAMKQSLQSRMESEMIQTNIAILNLALPPINPSSPKMSLNLLLSIFFGTTLGIVVVFLSELQNRYVRSAIDISENLNLPVFGIITTQRQHNKKSIRSFFT